MSANTTPVREISLVAVITKDQDRAIAFYESIGFQKRSDIPMGDSYRWVEVYPPDGTTGIALSTPPPGRDASPTQTGIILRTDDIEAAHARFQALGVDVDPDISRMGGPVPPMFWFRDADGHSLLVVESQGT